MSKEKRREPARVQRRSLCSNSRREPVRVQRRGLQQVAARAREGSAPRLFSNSRREPVRVQRREPFSNSRHEPVRVQRRETRATLICTLRCTTHHVSILFTHYSGESPAMRVCDGESPWTLMDAARGLCVRKCIRLAPRGGRETDAPENKNYKNIGTGYYSANLRRGQDARRAIAL